MSVLDTSLLPRTGKEFLLILQMGVPFIMPLKNSVRKKGDFPKIFIARYTLDGISDNLINVWVFEDSEATAKIIGGLAGPTSDVVNNWRQFEVALAKIEDQVEYELALGQIEKVVSGYVKRRADLFA